MAERSVAGSIVGENSIIRFETPRHACPSCRRKFTNEALSRHQNPCKSHLEKIKNRIPFDSQKQRSPSISTTKPPKLNSVKWREAHSMWITNKSGLKVKKSKTSTTDILSSAGENPSCPGCGKSIPKDEIDTHIPFCVEANKHK